MALPQGHRVPGSGNVKGDGVLPRLDTEYGRWSAAICFDLDFPRLIRQAGRMNADLLLAPSNDWTEVREMHLRMHILRAVEQGFTLFRPTKDGISAAADPYGRIPGPPRYRDLTGQGDGGQFARAGRHDDLQPHRRRLFVAVLRRLFRSASSVPATAKSGEAVRARISHALRHPADRMRILGKVAVGAAGSNLRPGRIRNTRAAQLCLYKPLKKSHLQIPVPCETPSFGMLTVVCMVSPTGEIWNTVFAQLESFNSLRDMSLAA